MTTLHEAFKNEDKARQYLEANRWPNGPVCPFCKKQETVTALPPKGSMGAGWYHCRECRQKFTVRVGTLYERSHVPLHLWLYATHLLTSSKKGISSHQLHRMLGVTYKTAWFMSMRIREGMKPAANEPPLGGEGKTVEADEFYTGRKAGKRIRQGVGHKIAVLALVERKGRVRSFKIAKVDKKTVHAHIHTNVDRKSHLMTDEAPYYLRDLGMKHSSVNHSAREYVRGKVSTNVVEGVFSVLQRGLIGTYQHVGEQHLGKYLTEFDFRYNTRARLGFNDTMRAEIALKGIEGRRLTYRRVGQA